MSERSLLSPRIATMRTQYVWLFFHFERISLLFFSLRKELGPLENACASQPCLNGGQCFPDGSSFQCQCAPGFDGKTCELDATICQSQYPCGQSPDVRCQSFRLGAALPYVCIFQDGVSYGLSQRESKSSLPSSSSKRNEMIFVV